METSLNEIKTYLVLNKLYTKDFENLLDFNLIPLSTLRKLETKIGKREIIKKNILNFSNSIELIKRAELNELLKFNLEAPFDSTIDNLKEELIKTNNLIEKELQSIQSKIYKSFIMEKEKIANKIKSEIFYLPYAAFEIEIKKIKEIFELIERKFSKNLPKEETTQAISKASECFALIELIKSYLVTKNPLYTLKLQKENIHKIVFISIVKILNLEKIERKEQIRQIYKLKDIYAILISICKDEKLKSKASFINKKLLLNYIKTCKIYEELKEATPKIGEIQNLKNLIKNLDKKQIEILDKEEKRLDRFVYSDYKRASANSHREKKLNHFLHIISNEAILYKELQNWNKKVQKIFPIEKITQTVSFENESFFQSKAKDNSEELKTKYNRQKFSPEKQISISSKNLSYLKASSSK